MTAPAIPADAVWGIQWEVPVLPDNHPDVPPQPQQPDSEWTDAPDGPWAIYNTAINQWYQDILALLVIHPDWWHLTVSSCASEDHARRLFPDVAGANANNPFTRNTTLVWSSPVVWTPVE